MSNKPLIGLLCSNLSTEIYSDINLELPITLVQFTPGGIDWQERKIRGLALENGNWADTVASFPDAVYNQLYTSSTKIARRLECYIGEGRVFNICTMFDKYAIYNIFYGSHLEKYMIPTWSYDPVLLLINLSQGKSMLIKPSKGSYGNNVIKIKKTGQIYETFYQSTHPSGKWPSTRQLFAYIYRVMRQNKYNFVIQPFINFITDEGNVFDMRFLVQKNGNGEWEVSADLSRVSYDDFFITNMSYEILPVEEMLKMVGKDCNLISQMKSLSIDAAKLLESKLGPLGEISVDFGIEENGDLRIIEINGKPDKSLFEDINDETYAKTIITPLQYAEFLTKL